jgi:hypothetical protein
MILSSVRAALATQIADATGLADNSGYAPAQINPPCFVLLPGKPFATYNATMAGSAGMGSYMGAPAPTLTASPTLINLVCLVLVSDSPEFMDWQTNLENYLGFGPYTSTQLSVPWAIEADNTLGGVVEWCIPTSVGQYGLVEYNGITYAGAHLNLQLSVE